MTRILEPPQVGEAAQIAMLMRRHGWYTKAGKYGTFLVYNEMSGEFAIPLEYQDQRIMVDPLKALLFCEDWAEKDRARNDSFDPMI